MYSIQKGLNTCMYLIMYLNAHVFMQKYSLLSVWMHDKFSERDKKNLDFGPYK